MEGNLGEGPENKPGGSTRRAGASIAAALLLGIVLGLAACGGDGDDGGSVTLGEGTYSVTKATRASTADELTSKVPELGAFGQVQDPIDTYLVVEINRTGSEKKVGVAPEDLIVVGGDGREYESAAQSFQGGSETVLLVFDVPEAAIDSAELQLEGQAIPLPTAE